MPPAKLLVLVLAQDPYDQDQTITTSTHTFAPYSRTGCVVLISRRLLLDLGPPSRLNTENPAAILPGTGLI